MPGRGLRAAVAALAVGLAAPQVSAQDRFVVPSPVLTVDQDRLFEGSAFGRRVQSELEAEATALAAENRRLEAELAEEERRLTELRPTTDPAEFREMAAAFDARVVEVRRAQDQKGRELTLRPEEARQEFYRVALPVLAELVRERGAVAILDARAVLLSADAIDITNEAIARIDAVIGEGPIPAGAPGAPETPQPTPEAPVDGTPQPAPESGNDTGVPELPVSPEPAPENDPP